MGSSSSKQSGRSDASPSLLERMTEWCSTHRYASLGIAASVVVLGVLATRGPSDSDVTEVTDELAGLELPDAVDELGLLVETPAPVRPRAVRPETTVAFDDLTPFFNGSANEKSGVMTATFEGPGRSVETGPVWLAGTIETDDFPTESITVPPSAGPLLFPQ